MSGQVSTSSVTPSPSVSFCESAQPSASTASPAGVSGHKSEISAIPSESESKTRLPSEVINIFAPPTSI